ncbi:MAG: PDZ domain-containing protein, partial [Candidatus Eremiobacteraeota bacterium]|nr:PDZ domain-containing protein [Candidatus Eremiobacteraeota bacterium]
LPSELTGVVVAEVLPGGPAARGGLQAGDVITQVGGQSIQAPRQLVEQATSAKVGSELDLTRYRDGMSKNVTLTVAEPSERPQPCPADRRPVAD